MHHSNIAIAILVGLLGLAITSCNTCNEEVPELAATDRELELVDTSLTSGEPCQAPCWRGLVPGRSTPIKAMEALEQSTFIDQTSITRQPWSSFPEWEYIHWNSAVAEWGLPIGDILVDAQGHIARIRIILEYELTIEELADSFGPPDVFTIVPAYSSPRCHLVDLVWLEEGIGAVPRLTPASKNDQLVTPETLIRSVVYFAPASTVEEYLLNTGPLDEAEANQRAQSLYVQWTGFESVKYSTLFPSD
jgi:hypothetical protein